MRKQTVRVACLVVLSAACLGCIWDSDTLAHEAKGIPNVIAVTTGRFERNPPLYYEMRLGRATRQIAQNSADFAAYDDSGASCDRLGRGDEAIRWMERKRQAMDQAGEPANSEHRYRYLANVGTFWAHRWFRNGADRSRIGEMKRAAETIRKAIAMNPNAHFGREKYQLMAMDWIINAPSWEQTSVGNSFLAYSRQKETVGRLAEVDYDEAAHGITGLIALGGAWESVDVFHALSFALARQMVSIPSYMAALRAAELMDAGRISIVRGAPKGQEFKRYLHIGSALLEPRKREVERKFRELRDDADRWHAERTEFMLARLRAGRHPDTDPRFWDGFRERPAPSLEMSPLDKPWMLPALATGATTLVAGMLLLYRRRQRNRLIPTA